MRIKLPQNDVGVFDAVEGLLDSVGFHGWRSDEGLQGTPERMVRAYKELLSGYDKDAATVLGTTFPADGYDEVVVLKHVAFSSLCEHHMLPFTGEASIAYLPGDRIVGLSKLARLVEMHARRLQVQERMTRDIAEAIESVLRPRATAVLVNAHHSCMGCRGVNKPTARMVTSAVRGSFRTVPESRAEILKLME